MRFLYIFLIFSYFPLSFFLFSTQDARPPTLWALALYMIISTIGIVRLFRLNRYYFPVIWVVLTGLLYFYETTSFNSAARDILSRLIGSKLSSDVEIEYATWGKWLDPTVQLTIIGTEEFKNKVTQGFSEIQPCGSNFEEVKRFVIPANKYSKHIFRVFYKEIEAIGKSLFIATSKETSEIYIYRSWKNEKNMFVPVIYQRKKNNGSEEVRECAEPPYTFKFKTLDKNRVVRATWLTKGDIAQYELKEFDERGQLNQGKIYLSPDHETHKGFITYTNGTRHGRFELYPLKECGLAEEIRGEYFEGKQHGTWQTKFTRCTKIIERKYDQGKQLKSTECPTCPEK